MASPIPNAQLARSRVVRGAFAEGPLRRAESGAGPSDHLEERTAALARGQPALRRAIAALAGRLVALRAWERLGFARLRDYAVERLGTSARTVQDWSYVDCALAELPLLDAALLRGDLPWTSVRLLARVATPADEQSWIERARQVSARTLEREVRQVDIGSLGAKGSELSATLESDGRREGIVVRCTPQTRGKWNRARQLANRVAGERMPTWACAEAVAAEVASALPADPHFGRTDGEPLEATRGLGRRRRRGRDPMPERSTRRLKALPRSLRPLLAGLEAADAFELDRRLRRALAMEQRREAELGPLLHRIVHRRSYRSWGYATLDEYARERLAMSPRRVHALLRIERVARCCPEIVASYRTGTLSWVKVHALLPIARIDAAPHAAWVAWAQRITVRRLQEDVDRAVSERELQVSPIPQPPGSSLTAPCRRSESGVTANLQTRARSTRLDETALPFFSAPTSVARLFRAVLCSTRRHLERSTGRLPSEGEAFEAMIDHALGAWGADHPRSKRAHRVFARDGWRCTAPGCTSYRNLHDHHIRFRSAGGSDALSNRTTLCAWHHLRGVHGGSVRCFGEAPDRLRFELGVRSGQAPLAVYRSGDIADLTGRPLGFEPQPEAAAPLDDEA